MEQLIPQAIRRLTEEEYLQMEEAAPTKHEYRNGEVIDMAGATVDHVSIATNLITEMTVRLKGKPCKAFGSDLRVRIKATSSYCYPDVTVVRSPLEFARPDRRTTIINPHLVVEVGSPTTESRDRGEKFDDYRRIESLREYILVSQDRARVELSTVKPMVSGP